MSTLPRLNRRLTLEDPQKVPDNAGGFDTAWVPLGIHWAQVQSRSGREVGVAGGPVSEVSYRITVRAAPMNSPSRPRPEQRFRDGARIFSIRAVSEQDPSGLYLTCFVEEEVVA